jgi:hypothetical protein
MGAGDGYFKLGRSSKAPGCHPLQSAALGSISSAALAPLGGVTLRQEILVSNFTTRSTPREPDDTAPDGSEVRLLAQLDSCGMAGFRFASGEGFPSRGASHGRRDLVRSFGSGGDVAVAGGREEVVPLSAGLSMTIPVGTRFQFRAVDGRTLFIVGVTIPRWPGPEEAQLREGRYSIHQSDRDVFHKHSDCPSGKQIPAQNKRLGTNIYPLCKHCRDK